MPILIRSSPGFYVIPDRTTCSTVAWLYGDRVDLINEIKTICDLMLAGF